MKPLHPKIVSLGTRSLTRWYPPADAISDEADNEVWDERGWQAGYALYSDIYSELYVDTRW